MPWTEKRWVFVGVVTEQALVAAAILHAGYLGYAFAYAVDRRTGRHRRFELKTPLGLGADVATRPEGRSRFSSPQGAMSYDPARGALEIHLWEFQARVAIVPAAPFAASWQVPGGGAHRTEKRMGGQATGVLYLNGETLTLEGAAMIDWSMGRPGHETDWRWAAGAGRAGDRHVAWNLRTGFGDPKGLENAVWIDGRPQAVGPATVLPGDRWRVEAGDLQLVFTPEGEHREDLDMGLVASRYRQAWGACEGTLGAAPVAGYGVAEDHRARW